MRIIDADELKKQAYPFPCAIGVEYAVTLRQIDEAPTLLGVDGMVLKIEELKEKVKQSVLLNSQEYDLTDAVKRAVMPYDICIGILKGEHHADT